MSLFTRIARATLPVIALAIASGAHADTKQIKLGTMSGPDAQIWEVVQKVAKKDGRRP
jgi:D-methionine transport system substrate-binding protein